MWNNVRAGRNIQANKAKFRLHPARTFAKERARQPTSFPSEADVVIVGGGSAGCHTFYHLAKRGVKAVLLERAKLTAGTTWHSAGLVWRLRPSDVEIQLLADSRNMLMQLEAETGLDPGWIQNGGIFIAHTKTRLDEYKRLASIGDVLGIESHIIDAKETQKLFPLLDAESFLGALYSPGDGVVDPTMLCTALAKAAATYGAQVIEECEVTDLLVEDVSPGGRKKVLGVATSLGNIKTSTVVNAAGVWSRDLIRKHGSFLPLIAMKHAYVVSETIPSVRGLPNIRDHDYSTYFRIQGDAICMGGYEANPVLLDAVPREFHFGLYDLDWSVFEAHLTGASMLCPSFGKFGIKSTICGPESFTPDHKPLMGPDTKLCGLFHNCAFNSAGMMFGGGCGQQIALWILNGKPDLPIFSFDLRRFTESQCRSLHWIKQKSHESYAKNYSLVFKHDQPLAGRNFQTDPLQQDMLEQRAFMEEKQGWERPGFFAATPAPVLPYDWYGSYGYESRKDDSYKRLLDGDLNYDRFSAHHDVIGAEALACRNNAALFNMSYFCKLYLEGPQAKEAADWIFSGKIDSDTKRIVYTCALNDSGGVEADVTVCCVAPGTNVGLLGPQFESPGFYIVAGGASAHYTHSVIAGEVRRMKFNARVHDVTAAMGVISVQGARSRDILQTVVDADLTDQNIPPNSTQLVKWKDHTNAAAWDARVMRVSFVGELGYELHVSSISCSALYRRIMAAGKECGLRNAGYRALYSLSSEKGNHLWGFDLRPDDTPLEAGIAFTCRKNGEYKGKQAVDEQRSEGLLKRLVYLSLEDRVPIWGLEGVYRNGEAVGYLRRGEYAYALQKPFGQAYIQRPDRGALTADFITDGDYEIDVMGRRYKAKCHLKSPFDPKGKRILGIYS